MSIAPEPTVQPPYGAPTPPPQQQSTNGVAIAGFVLAFLLSPVGLILSIVGLIQARKKGQKGSGLAIGGIIVSLLGTIVWAILIVTVILVAPTASKLADPGCVQGKAAVLANQPDPNADAAAYKTTMQKAVTELRAAAAKAKHDDVRAAVNTVADDYEQLVTAVDAGDTAKVESLQSKVETDAGAMDSLCTLGAK